MSNGIPECRQAVTRWIKKRYSVDVDFERILNYARWKTNNELCNSMFW
jgi:aspartate/methionine/tyrosine aminotransferase